MKILITNSFLKDFEKTIKLKNWLNIFLQKLKESNIFRLNDETKKFKFYISNISVRGIVFINEYNIGIPILIVKKSDKKYWSNLVLNKEIEDILKIKLVDMNSDLIKWKYKKYEI